MARDIYMHWEEMGKMLPAGPESNLDKIENTEALAAAVIDEDGNGFGTPEEDSPNYKAFQCLARRIAIALAIFRDAECHGGYEDSNLWMDV